MKNYLNIDKSAFRKGEYVGYSNGVWLITKSSSSYGNWCARKRDDTREPLVFAFTLAGISDKLSNLGLPTNP